jgi:short chain dehydrogenase
MPDLTGKRVLILGAETEIGRAVTTAVAEVGASVAAVAATSDAEAAFAVQRLARRLSSGEHKVIAQAIDATNEAAVRVMVRQVSKELGGLDAVVISTISPNLVDEARDRALQAGQLVVKAGNKEFTLRSGGVFVAIDPFWGHAVPLTMLLEFGVLEAKKRWPIRVVPAKDLATDETIAEIITAIAGEADSG